MLRVASELGYQPHVHARSLAQRRTSLVSAVIPMMTTYFFLEVLRGLQDGLAERGFDLLVYSARTMDNVECQIARALQRGMSAGLCVFSSPLTPRNGAIVRESGCPTVFVDCHHPQFDSVSMDNEVGGYVATEHIISQGRSRVALVMGHPTSVPAADRRAGYERALTESGLPVDEEIIVACGDEQNHGYSEQEGYAAMRRLLEIAVPPDAVFATSDVQALGVMTALRSAGLSVPDDVSVVGFDDLPLSRHIGLTTLRQPMYEMGRAASDKLAARIDRPDAPVTHTVFSPALQTRRSTVAEAMEDRVAQRQEVPLA